MKIIKTKLTVPHEIAQEKINKQINETNGLPNVDINDNHDAECWYEYTEELLRQIFTTDEIADEFTGRNSPIVFGDITVGAYLNKLKSIYKRLELFKDDNFENKKQISGYETTITIKLLNLIERKLRKVIREIPNKEKEIQDAFENLLIGSDIEYDREFPTIKYSSKNYIPDFSFSTIDTALEIKLCTTNRKEKTLIAEINDDILAYKTKFSNLIFVIYDNGQIRDIEKFSNSFIDDNTIVRVIKH